MLFQLLGWQLVMLSYASAQESSNVAGMGLRVTIHTDTTVTQAQVMPGGRKIKTAESVLYHWYSSNHIHMTRGGFGGKLLHGKYARFRYPEKGLLEQGAFWKGRKNGSWKSWYGNGEMKQNVRWKNGRMHGHFYEYNNAGEIIRAGRYRKDKLHGLLKTYYRVDSLEIRRFKKGRLLNKNRRIISKLGRQLKSKLLPRKDKNRAVKKSAE
nr:hypothetical protein [uncultured Dyadobacter sp.]